MTSGIQIRGSYTPAASAPNLVSLFGYVVGTLNMMPGFSGCDGKTFYGPHTDFNLMLGPAGTQGASISSSPPRLSPDGTFNTQKLVENSAGGVHEMADMNIGDVGAYHPIPFRTMVIAKPDGRDRFVLVMYNNRPTEAVSVGFNITTGQTYGSTVGASNKYTFIAASMQSLGNGFYACFLDWSFNTAVAGTAYNNINLECAIQLDNGTGTAAPSTNYVGDGVSGIQTWVLHMLPLAAWSWNPTRVFHDDFDSIGTVDVSDTRASGFNWYVHNDWPHRVWNNDGHNPTLDPCPASALSISQPSVLKIYNLAAQPSHDFGAEQWNSSIMTAAYTSGTGLGSAVGQYFGPPMIMDSSFIYDDRWQLGHDFDHTNNCAFWSISIESLTGAGNLGPNSGYTEWDITDSVPGQGDTSAMNYTENLAPGAGANFCARVMGSRNAVPQRWPNIPLRATGLWLDTSHSGVAGWGIVLKFIDGQLWQNVGGYAMSNTVCVYSSVALMRPQPPSGTLPNFIGWGTVNEQQHLPPILWGSASNLASLGSPMMVDWVSVWK